MVGKTVTVWFWRATGAAMIEAYRLRLGVAAQFTRLGRWPTAILAFGIPFLGGATVSVLSVLLRGA